MHSNRTRGSEHKPENEKFQINVRKFFFTLKFVKRLEFAAQRGCGISLLRVVENVTRQLPELKRPALGSDVDYIISEVHFHSKLFCVGLKR